MTGVLFITVGLIGVIAIGLSIYHFVNSESLSMPKDRADKWNNQIKDGKVFWNKMGNDNK